jgi:formylglycine-generating enzyme
MSGSETATGRALRQVPTAGMTWVPGGQFRMGSADFYPEEQPVRTVAVDGFWIDTRPVTVAEFRRFVKRTGYATVAEEVPDPARHPGADPDLLVPGSLVFRKTAGPVDLREFGTWWTYSPGACWRCPEGPGSSVTRRDKHPVTHIAYRDAQAYADWAGKELPTETEWEYAARGGLDGAVYVWGDDFRPAGQLLANTWHGEFPWQNLALDGYESTSPVASFPANGYGLYDMTGNVWEWTTDAFQAGHWPDQGPDWPSCVPRHPRMTARDHGAFPPGDIARRVIKGGSYLCAPTYCLRYRPAARHGEAVGTSSGHLGFRCVLRPSSLGPGPACPGPGAAGGWIRLRARVLKKPEIRLTAAPRNTRLKTICTVTAARAS